jgi:hypothetical protein
VELVALSKFMSLYVRSPPSKLCPLRLIVDVPAFTNIFELSDMLKDDDKFITELPKSS